MRLGLLTTRLQKTFSATCLCNCVVHDGVIFQKKKLQDFTKMYETPESRGSCFHQALLQLHQDQLYLVLYMCLRHVRSACPGSPGEYREKAFRSWQPTGWKNSTISSLWLGDDWNDSARVVSVASVTFLKKTAVWSFFASTFSNFPLLENDQLQRKSSPL